MLIWLFCQENHNTHNINNMWHDINPIILDKPSHFYVTLSFILSCYYSLNNSSNLMKELN